MKYYFTLQYRMLNRNLIEFGLPPVAGYILGLLGFIGLSEFLFYKTEFAAPIYVLLAVFAMAPWGAHQRNQFLKTCFNKQQYRRIRWMENALTALPFALFLLSKFEFLYGLGVLLLVPVLAMFQFENRFQGRLPTPFSRRPYEFPTGFRQAYPLFLLAYFLCVMGIGVGNFNLGAFALLLIFLCCMSFYGTPEGPYLVWIFAMEPRRFIWEKIKTAALYSVLLSLPIAGGLIWFFPENTYPVLGIMLLGSAYLMLMVLAKYAAFPEKINVPQAFMLGLSLWFPPMLLLVGPYFYKRAQERLKFYLQ
ncbi:MAG: hypothetical protein R2792_05600 [Saprospiraceae bacterium]